MQSVAPRAIVVNVEDGEVWANPSSPVDIRPKASSFPSERSFEISVPEESERHLLICRFCRSDAIREFDVALLAGGKSNHLARRREG